MTIDLHLQMKDRLGESPAPAVWVQHLQQSGSVVMRRLGDSGIVAGEYAGREVNTRHARQPFLDIVPRRQACFGADAVQIVAQFDVEAAIRKAMDAEIDLALVQLLKNAVTHGCIIPSQ